MPKSHKTMDIFCNPLTPLALASCGENIMCTKNHIYRRLWLQSDGPINKAYVGSSTNWFLPPRHKDDNSHHETYTCTSPIYKNRDFFYGVTY